MIRRHPLVAFFMLAYAISWLLWAPLWLPAFGLSGLPILPFHHALGALGPISAAFVVSAIETGPAGAVDLLRRMGLWSNRLGWVAVAVVGPFALLGLAVAGAWFVGGERVSLAGLGRSSEFPQFSAFAFLAFNIVTWGFGEEVGWRGFALPRLQMHRSALGATLLLAVAWAGWHAPLFLYRAAFTSMDAAGAAGWLFSLATGAILLTWLYNASRGSILVAAIFHSAIDVAFTSTAATPFVVNATGALITVWGLIVLLAAGPRYLSRGGKMIGPHAGSPVTEFDLRAPPRLTEVGSA